MSKVTLGSCEVSFTNDCPHPPAEPFDFDFPPGMTRPVVLILCHDREALLRQALMDLSRQSGIDGFDVVVSLDSPPHFGKYPCASFV